MENFRWRMAVRNTICRRIERKRNIALCLDLAKALISARARAALLSLETTSKSPSDSKLLLSNIEKMLRKAMQTCIIGYFENFRFDLLLDNAWTVKIEEGSGPQFMVVDPGTVWSI